MIRCSRVNSPLLPGSLTWCGKERSDPLFSGKLTSFAGLNLARTSYFAILDSTGGGGCHPPARLPLIEIELRNRDRRKDRDLLNLTIPAFTTLDHILSLPLQAKQKNVAFLGRSSFSQITLELRKIENNAKHHRIPLVKTHRNICILTPKGQFENLTLGQVK